MIILTILFIVLIFMLYFNTFNAIIVPALLSGVTVAFMDKILNWREGSPGE